MQPWKYRADDVLPTHTCTDIECMPFNEHRHGCQPALGVLTAPSSIGAPDQGVSLSIPLHRSAGNTAKFSKVVTTAGASEFSETRLIARREAARPGRERSYVTITGNRRGTCAGTRAKDSGRIFGARPL